MSAKKAVHFIVEEPREGFRKSLCGRVLVTHYEKAWAMMNTKDIDEYLEFCRIAVVSPPGECNWRTIEEFEDGDDDVDCLKCWRALGRIYAAEDEAKESA